MTVPFRRLWLTSVSAGVLCLTLTSYAYSDDFVVDGPETTTQTVDGDDTLTITEDGSITTTGNNEHGVESSGDENTIINGGTILTEGSGAYGINSTGDYATITNNGKIDAEIGVFNDQGNGTTIVNKGTIEAELAGIINSLGGKVTILNSGVINAGSDGIQNLDSPEEVTIINSGVIQADIIGIKTERSEDVAVVNSGVIQADEYGISNFMAEDVTIINSGEIQAKEYGIYNLVSNDVTITNTGSIISETSSSIFVHSSSSGTTVNLHAPGFLGGAITFNSSTTLAITTGASHSVLWTLPTSNLAGGAASVSGPVPWFYDQTTGQFATFDPTVLTASFNQLADTSNTLARLGRYGLGRARSGTSAESTASALLGYDEGADTDDRFDILLATNSGPGTAYGPASGRFWITGFGGYANYDGDDATLDQRIDQIGAALGYAWQQSRETRLSVMAGYMNGEITAKSPWADSQDIDSNGVFAGVYGDRRFGRLILGLGLAGGWQTNDSTRFVNDNLATTGGLTLGESAATSFYDSWFVTPEATLSADIDLGQTGLVLAPTVRGRYALQRTGGYTESGSNANATVDAYTLGVAEGDFELALSRSFSLATITGRAGYLVRSSAGDDDVPVTLLGITNSVGLGATDRSAAYLGAALDLDLGPQASFTLDGQGYLSDDIDALEGMARFAIRF